MIFEKIWSGRHGDSGGAAGQGGSVKRRALRRIPGMPAESEVLEAEINSQI